MSGLYAIFHELTGITPTTDTYGPDYAAKRAAFATLMTTAGGYNALTDTEKTYAARLFLVEDHTEHKAQILNSVKASWTHAETLATSTLATKTAADTAKTAADDTLTAAIAALDSITNEPLLAARNAAAAEHATALAAHSVNETAYGTASLAQYAAQQAVLAAELEQPYTTKTGSVTTATTAVADAQAALDADPENTELQDALTAAQANLSTAEATLAAHDALLATLATAQATFATAVDAHQTTQNTLVDKRALLETAQANIDAVYTAPYTNQLTAADNATQLAIANAQAALASDPDNTELQDAVTAAQAARLATLEPLLVLKTYQLNMTSAKAVVATKTSLAQQANSAALQATQNYTERKTHADSLAKSDLEWASLANLENTKHSILYHQGMLASRDRRIKMCTTFLFRNLGVAPTQVMANTLKDLQWRYVNAGIRGIREGNSLEGLWDFLYSYTGTSFEGQGFLQISAVVLNDTETLETLRDRVVVLLNTGA